MKYVDEINMQLMVARARKLYSTAGTHFKKLCLQNKLKLIRCIRTAFGYRYKSILY